MTSSVLFFNSQTEAKYVTARKFQLTEGLRARGNVQYRSMQLAKNWVKSVHYLLYFLVHRKLSTVSPTFTRFRQLREHKVYPSTK